MITYSITLFRNIVEMKKFTDFRNKLLLGSNHKKERQLLLPFFDHYLSCLRYWITPPENSTDDFYILHRSLIGFSNFFGQDGEVCPFAGLDRTEPVFQMQQPGGI